VITDFKTHNYERIYLSGVTGITDYADFIANHVQDSGGFALIVDGANSILLQNVSYQSVINGINGFTADDFIF
jgi:hypothetical protein